MKKQITPEEAYRRLAARLAASESCRTDVEKKLQMWEVPSKAAAKVIQQLVAEGFLSEERYVRAFVHDKMRFAHWGKYKIVAALRAKGIDEQLYASVFAEQDEEEVKKQVYAALRAKRRTMRASSTMEATQKLFRFGQSRGYETKYVLQAIDHLKREENEDKC